MEYSKSIQYLRNPGESDDSITKIAHAVLVG